MKNASGFVTLSTVALVLVAGVSMRAAGVDAQNPAAKVVHVKIVSNAKTIGAYVPKTLTVHRGTKVVFKNVSNAPHTVSTESNGFDSGNINQGKTWTFTAKKAGTFKYICQYHPGMHGTIIVK